MEKWWILTFYSLVLHSWINAQAIELRAGKNLMPADHFGIRYSHYTNSEVNLASDFFIEFSHQNGLRYKSFGIDLIAQYVFGRGKEGNSAISFMSSIGLTGHIESEPWIYHDLSFSQRFNYGIVAEGSGKWMMSEVFGLNLFAQQRWLFNKRLGSTGFVFGFGLVYHFN